MMDYSKNIFGLSLDELSFSDIEDFFLIEREESSILEFKSFHPNAELTNSLNGIIECVSGFLNSQGGIVIWGAPIGEKKTGSREKIFRGDLTPLEYTFTKDKLVNDISFPIQPLPINIKVKVLQNQSYKNVYVFEVQESIYKPTNLNISILSV